MVLASGFWRLQHVAFAHQKGCLLAGTLVPKVRLALIAQGLCVEAPQGTNALPDEGHEGFRENQPARSPCRLLDRQGRTAEKQNQYDDAKYGEIFRLLQIHQFLEPQPCRL